MFSLQVFFFLQGAEVFFANGFVFFASFFARFVFFLCFVSLGGEFVFFLKKILGLCFQGI